MSNTFSQLYSTILGVADEITKAPSAAKPMLESIYIDKNIDLPGVLGQQINIPYYDIGPLADIGANAPTISPLNPYTNSLIMQHHPAKSYGVSDYDQWNVRPDLVRAFLEAVAIRVAEYMEQQISALCTPANFASNYPLPGQYFGQISPLDVENYFAALAQAKVPMGDKANLSLVMNHKVFSGNIGQDYWTRQNVLGTALAEKARQDARLPDTMNFVPKWGQFMPGGATRPIYGQVILTNGSSTVTGYATGFTSDTPAGTTLVFASDPTRTQYTVSAVTSDTQLTLSVVYAGASNGYTTATATTAIAGTLAITTNTAAVVGTSTSFLTKLFPGSWIVFTADATKTPYQVLTITDNTHLTLASNYAGSTLTAGVATDVTNYTLALHRSAIALAPRRIGGPVDLMNKVADVMYVNLYGIPVRLAMGWTLGSTQTQVLADFGYGLSVMRGTFGQVILN